MRKVLRKFYFWCWQVLACAGFSLGLMLVLVAFVMKHHALLLGCGGVIVAMVSFIILVSCKWELEDSEADDEDENVFLLTEEVEPIVELTELAA